MTIEDRILTCRLIEQMEQDKYYAGQLGLKDQSTFCGRPVHSSTSPACSRHSGCHLPAEVSDLAD